MRQFEYALRLINFFEIVYFPTVAFGWATCSLIAASAATSETYQSLYLFSSDSGVKNFRNKRWLLLLQLVFQAKSTTLYVRLNPSFFTDIISPLETI